ncbi:MAG: hypothetical protein MZV63_44805 [Marinilabiliales bacterium]|nr:hypothetical protein [Marinilabiliales bacterium]
MYGGTYFKPQQWKDLLQNISLAYKSDKKKFEETANELKNGIVSLSDFSKTQEVKDVHYEELLDIFIKLRKRFDRENGGFIGAQNFLYLSPTSPCSGFLIIPTKKKLKSMFCLHSTK